ncbi:MAG: T9SS type A sorting domain-containing protein [Bacteroidia bacterium]
MPHGTNLYSFTQANSSRTWLFALAADSVTVDSTDSIYHIYRITRPLLTEQLANCNGDSIQHLAGTLLVNKDHYLGKTLRIHPDGDCTFEFMNGSSYLLRSRAGVGTTWNWAPGVTAVVDSVVLGSVLGQADSIKFIGLSTGQTIALSRSHGLVQIHNLYPFPGHDGLVQDVEFKIWGIPALNLGGHLPTYGEIFQFHPGDRFQYYGRIQDPQGYSERYENRRVIAQTPGSRFEYQDSFERVQFIYPNSFPIYTVYDPWMTILDPYDSAAHYFIGLLPYQDSHGQTQQIGMTIRAGNTRVELHVQDLSGFDSCAQAHILFEYVRNRRFTEGLGMTLSRETDVSLNVVDSLLCYSVQQESWGNCVNISALAMSVDAPIEAAFQMYPNPAHDQVQLALPPQMAGHAGQLEVFSADGRLLMSRAIPTGNTHKIDLRGLPAGLHLVRLSIAGHAPITKRLVVD